MTDHLARQPLFNGSWRVYVLRNSSSSATARIFNPTGSFIGQLAFDFTTPSTGYIEHVLRGDAREESPSGPRTTLLWLMKEDNPVSYEKYIAPMRSASPPDTAGES